MEQIKPIEPTLEEQLRAAYDNLDSLYGQKQRLEENPAAYKPALYKELLGTMNENIAQAEKKITDLEGKLAA